MRLITDFHIHSKYSRACSKELVPEKLNEWAGYKGIELLGTGDFTHPLWLKELEEKLEPAEAGFYRLKPRYQIPDTRYSKFSPVRFMLTAEVASIYSQGGKLRRIHTVLVAPSFDAVRKINKELANLGNLTSDGRPILGLSAKGLARIAFEADPTCLVIPAHAWTPWFSVFGSKSGFNSLEECYEELAPSIFAIETGLSSDPEMNWRLSSLDHIALTSSSDAHSLPNLGREATVFELKTPTYDEMVQALKTKDPQQLKSTIEFYPEEGKYHYDGHALCKVVLAPAETKRHSGRCPACGKPLTIGVDYRVDELADRPADYVLRVAPRSQHIVPLAEIMADAFDQKKGTKKVEAEYWRLIHGLGNEFSILLDLELEEIAQVAGPLIVEGIRRVRAGEILVKPGYDGVYGIVKVFDPAERQPKTQKTLF
jgi:uncharacterized protein (TIGR00375 family)